MIGVFFTRAFLNESRQRIDRKKRYHQSSQCIYKTERCGKKADKRIEGLCIGYEVKVAGEL